MNRDRLVSILAAGGRRLGPDAVVMEVGQSLRLPHAVVEVEAVVADAGLLAVLYRERVEGGFGVTMVVHRGTAYGGCMWHFRDPDGDLVGHVTPDPEAGPEALRLSVRETRLGRVAVPHETGTADLDLPQVAWEGRTLASTAVGAAEIGVDQCAFGGLGGRARIHMRGDGSVAAILNDRFREMWLPSPGASAPFESGDARDLPPPKLAPRLQSWGADFSLVARSFSPFPGSGGMGTAATAHGRVTDPDGPMLTDLVAFDRPAEGRVQLVCKPMVWERAAPVLFGLSPDDAGRRLRVRGGDGSVVEAVVFPQSEPGQVDWAARPDTALPVRLGLLERRVDSERADYGEWQAVPNLPDTDGWQRMRSRIAGPEGRAEIACVARGVQGPSFTLGTRPPRDAG